MNRRSQILKHACPFSPIHGVAQRLNFLLRLPLLGRLLPLRPLPPLLGFFDLVLPLLLRLFLDFRLFAFPLFLFLVAWRRLLGFLLPPSFLQYSVASISHIWPTYWQPSGMRCSKSCSVFKRGQPPFSANSSTQDLQSFAISQYSVAAIAQDWQPSGMRCSTFICLFKSEQPPFAANSSTQDWHSSI